MKKSFSLRLQGFEMPVLVEMTEEQIADLHAGKMVMCERVNTKTGDKSTFGFSPMGLISIQETEVKQYGTDPVF